MNDESFLGNLRRNLQFAIQWLPKGAIKPNQVQSSDTIGKVLTTTANGSEWQAASSGVTDHGLLTGLGDDDHPQYHNDARGDARYQPLDSDLTTIAGLTATTNNIIQSSGSAWASRTPAQVAATLPAASISGFDTQVRTSRMSDLTLPNAAVPMNSQKFTGLAAGSANGDSLRYEQLFTTGTLTLLGDLTIPGTVISEHATAPRYEVRVTGDSYARARLGYGPNPFLSFGPGSGLSDWYMNRTAANEVTISAGDVLRHDTMAENNNSTAVATTAYVDRATGNASTSRPACKLYGPTPTSISDATLTKITAWSSEAFDTDSMHDPVTNTGRITINTPGTYVVHAKAYFPSAAASNSNAYTAIYVNGTATHYSSMMPVRTVAAGIDNIFEQTVVIQLSAGDYLEMGVYYDSVAGGSNTLQTGAAQTTFSAAWVGGTGAAWGNAAARVTKSGAQSITTSSDTLLTWDTETLDSDSIHSTSVNTGRITIVTPGTYAIGAFVEWATNATGGRQAYIRLNGTTIIARDARPATSTTYFPSCSPATLYPLNAGDYLEVFVYQDSGGSLNVNSSSAFWASRVGYQTNPADLPGTYMTKMYIANSGSPTHTSNGGWQKVGGGGGTGTWTAEYDRRPPGVSAQADTSTNKRIDIRKTGVYRISFAASFGLSAGKTMYGAVYKNGSQLAAAGHGPSSAITAIGALTFDALLTSGDYLELYAFQTESAALAYDTSVASRNFLAIEYLGPAT